MALPCRQYVRIFGLLNAFYTEEELLDDELLDEALDNG